MSQYPNNQWSRKMWPFYICSNSLRGFKVHIPKIERVNRQKDNPRGEFNIYSK